MCEELDVVQLAVRPALMLLSQKHFTKNIGHSRCINHHQTFVPHFLLPHAFSQDLKDLLVIVNI